MLCASFVVHSSTGTWCRVAVYTLFRLQEEGVGVKREPQRCLYRRRFGDESCLDDCDLADATGCLYNSNWWVSYTHCLTSDGHVSLPFRCRADVILGAQKATQHGVAQSLSPHVAVFEVLRVTPVLLAEWDTIQRPLPKYVFQVKEACDVQCVWSKKLHAFSLLAFSTLAPLPWGLARPCSTGGIRQRFCANPWWLAPRPN